MKEEKYKTFKEFSEDTTLHGLRNVTREGAKYVRLFWTGILFAAIGVLLYFLYGILHKVTKPQMVTDTSVTFGQDKIPFPSVTICNFNQVRRSFARQNPLIKVVLMEWFASDDSILRSIISDGQDITALFPDIIQENETHWSANLTDVNNTMIRELFLDSAQPIDEALYNVAFGNTKIVTDQFNDYFKTVLTDMGVCYTFRGHTDEQPRYVYDIGAEFGLRLNVYLGTNDYFLSPSLRFEEGIVVLVHMEPDVPSMLTRGIQLEPHAAVSIALNRYQYIYDEEATDCLNTEAASFVNPLSTSEYSREACLRECKANYIFNGCRCRYIYEEGSGPFCVTHQEHTCQNKARYNFSLNNDGREQCDCPNACKQNGFKETVSNSKYFTTYMDEAYLGYIDQAGYWLAQYVRYFHGRFSDTIRLSIFYRELSLTKTKQVPSYTFNDAWGDIGGVFGLCFGASLFTLLELSVFCVIYAFQFILRRHRKWTATTPILPPEKDASEFSQDNNDNIQTVEKDMSKLPPEYPKPFLQ